MTGFIAIHRTLWDHPLFADGEMTEREAWIWMLSRAAWKDTRHRVGAETVTVERGSFITTLREMQKAFGWRSDKRVRTFLKMLENEGMIGRTVVGPTNAPKTHVTICNYNDYQEGGRTKDAPGTHRGRTGDAVKEQGNKKQGNPNGLQPDDVSDDVWSDFVQHRKRKRAVVTERVIAAIREQAAQAGWPLEDALAEVVTRNWQAFKADWVEKRETPSTNKPARTPQEWLAYCEEQSKKWREARVTGLAEEWDQRAREARARLPKLRIVE